GGWLGDYFGKKDRAAYAWLPAISFMLGVPLFAGDILSSSVTAAFLFFLIPQALAYVWLGPVLSAVQHLVPANMRATASASFLFINNLIGLGFGTLILGAMSDQFSQFYGDDGLRYAILSALVFYVAAAILMALAGRHLRREWVA
ncbi:MAG: hypothetical protein ABJ034_12910, partial [Hyphomicrobiales bacterium]